MEYSSSTVTKRGAGALDAAPAWVAVDAQPDNPDVRSKETAAKLNKDFNVLRFNLHPFGARWSALDIV